MRKSETINCALSTVNEMKRTVRSRQPAASGFGYAVLLMFLISIFSSAMCAQKLPDKIRGYKVYDAKISIKTDGETAEIKKDDKSAATIEIGEPEIAEVSLAGVTVEISAEISNLEQNATVDFLDFHDFRVNGLTVEIEEYKEKLSFEKNRRIKLPQPVRIFIAATQIVRGALREVKNSQTEWLVTGRIFVFGKFKKFGFAFKRVVPVEISVKIKNPLKKADDAVAPSK